MSLLPILFLLCLSSASLSSAAVDNVGSSSPKGIVFTDLGRFFRACKANARREGGPVCRSYACYTRCEFPRKMITKKK